MLQLTQCKISIENDTKEELIKKTAHRLHIRENQIYDLQIVKKSIDARKKPELFYTYTVQFRTDQEERVLKKNKKNQDLSRSGRENRLEDAIRPIEKKQKVVIAGAGPAGLFCAYYLSLCGLQPIIVERGAKVEERVLDIQKFWEQGILDEESNVTFGEGGAGTFSDGKLNTGVKDRSGRNRFVLETFVRFGAGEDILYDAKPHIGTDVLRQVIVRMRKEMIRCGCEFQFHTKLTELIVEQGTVKGIRVKRQDQNKEEVISCDKVVLAIGHSARDTFAMLHNEGVCMTKKPFAVGVRVQHRQTDIDCSQYGSKELPLPAAAYKCTGKTTDGRGVYSFCMCPGGYVVNASSEKDGLVVNGMSDVRRDSGYANSAIVVTVTPDDFEGEDCLAGVAFQRRWEQRAFALCKGKIPVQRYADFVKNRTTPACGDVMPCVKGRWAYGNIRNVLPGFVSNGIMEGMEQFGKKIQGFDDGDTLMLGLETRTSSPVRIERKEDCESVSICGLYPAGEGAGYAGGIMSAAIDGLRIAMEIQKRGM